jgi:hypothetical protein
MWFHYVQVILLMLLYAAVVYYFHNHAPKGRRRGVVKNALVLADS